MKRKASDITFDIFNTLLGIVICLIMIYPFIYVISVSLSDSLEIMRNKVTFYPRQLTFEAYRKIFEMAHIRRSFANSVFYTSVGTLLNILLTTSLAFPLSRKRLVGKKFFNMLIIIPLFFSGGIIPTYIVVRSIGIIDSMWAMVLPWAILSYYLILVITFFEGIPDEIIESASIDGANDIYIFARIILPMSTTIIATIGLFYAIDNWNNFSNALFYMFTKEKYPLALILKEMLVTSEMSQNTISTGEKLIVQEAVNSATIVISVIPILMVYPFVQKYFSSGITMGALKG